MAEVLTYAEAEEIYHVMEEGIDRRDEDIVGMYKDMIARAVKYANIRAGWNLKAHLRIRWLPYVL